MTTGRETELWDAFINGEKEAFSDLYRLSYSGLYSYGLSCGMDKHQADDAIQDIFVRLYVNPSLIRSSLTLRSFLFRSIKNFFINKLKADSRLMGIDEVRPSFSFTYSLDDSIIDQEERHIIRERVERLMAQLSTRQKEVVYLRFMHDMEYEEISRIMELTEQAARNLLYKALVKLRSCDTEELVIALLACAAAMQRP